MHSPTAPLPHVRTHLGLGQQHPDLGPRGLQLSAQLTWLDSRAQHHIQQVHMPKQLYEMTQLRKNVRRGHTSTVTSSGLVLVGGYGSTTTLELLGSGE